MSLVGKKAPSFTAAAVVNGKQIVDNFSLDQYLGQQEIILFFYTKDFTAVCPTEILAFQENLDEFEKRGVAVIGVSTDSEDSHLAWLTTPKKKGGIMGVTYPLVSDVSKTIAFNYGVLGGEYHYNDLGQLIFEGAPIAFRGTFFIDKSGIVRHEYINFFPLGRNIEDTIRIVDAWHHIEMYGEVCPANWKPGEDSIKDTPESIAEYLSRH